MKENSSNLSRLYLC